MPHPTSITPERAAKLRSVLERRQPSLTVVFENVHDPHNVSAVLRSCDATGVLEAHGIYTGFQVFPELGRKSSGSARKWVDLHLHDSVDECFSQLRRRGFRIYTTHMSSDAVSLYDVDLTQPVALVFGNEHSGVSDEARALADGNFVIPQMGVVQSLNISVACAVSLYEALRQRQRAGLYHHSALSEEDFAERLNDWYQR
ncbi:MAG: TrmH family RNA methyltransferase [Candidatus Kapaibacteriota bacterium]|jgi:tRNA (guanosine-2'-O-)-methyltransferase